jgi:hypothetical protein
MEKNSNPGSGMEKVGSGMEKVGSGIWDKHPESATLQKTCLFLVCYVNHTLVGLQLDSRKIQRTTSPSESTGSSATESI